MRIAAERRWNMEYSAKNDKWRGFYLDNAQSDQEDLIFDGDAVEEPYTENSVHSKHRRMNSKSKKASDLTIQRKIEKAQSERLYTDGELVQEVQRAIWKEGSISPSAKRVEVSAKNGIVTLKGNVQTEPEKMTIGDKAASFAGFGKVVNQIHILGESNKGEK
jgi:osmotically-inducible protein OsmY